VKEPFFFIGVGDPNRIDNQKYFRGYFDSLIIFSDVLSSDEILNLSQNYSYDNFELLDSIKLYYDAKKIINYKLVDLSGNKNDGEIVNCEIGEEKISDYIGIKIPFRRKSKFKLLIHPENGFMGYKWKDQSTRWNQLRFINEVSKNDNLIGNDGLTDLKYTLYGIEVINKITQINVGL